MTEPPDPASRHPAHGWGALAADPWLPIGADGPAYRDVLRRIWHRQGGSDAIFDRLIGPRAQGRPHAPRPKR